jgi:hypothetical protein
MKVWISVGLILKDNVFDYKIEDLFWEVDSLQHLKTRLDEYKELISDKYEVCVHSVKEI